MTRFSKLSGAGNDFIALAEPRQEPTASQIAAWCHRGTSIGADGLFVLARRDEHVRMRHFNSDGRPAALCLNGTRCAARLAFHLGWATGEVLVETDAGTFAAAEAGGHEVELELPSPDAAPRAVELRLGDTPWSGWQVEVGVPHLVLLWERPMGDAPVDTVGRALRAHPALDPDGANVDFVAFPRPGDMEIRSFERGVEAETLACGTGVLAAAVVALGNGLAELPLTALTRGGFAIGVRAAERAGQWLMRGDARLVVQGTLEPGATAAPRPPVW